MNAIHQTALVHVNCFLHSAVGALNVVTPPAPAPTPTATMVVDKVEQHTNSECTVLDFPKHNGECDKFELWEDKVHANSCQHKPLDFMDDKEQHKKNKHTSQAVFSASKTLNEDSQLVFLIEQHCNTKNPQASMKNAKDHCDHNCSVDFAHSRSS